MPPLRTAFAAAAARLSGMARAAFAYARRRPKRSIVLTSLALGVATQPLPQTVSTPLDDYMTSRGMPAIAPYFATGHIRVYNRYNVLQAWHSTTFMSRQAGPYLLRDPLKVFDLAEHNLTTFLTTFVPTTLDAYSIGSAENSARDQQCFIRPPGNAPLADYINGFTGFKAKAYATALPQAQMQKVFYTYIMAHEARHCDQRGWYRPNSQIIESDADLYALRVVDRIYGADAARELRALLLPLRTLSTVIGKDDGHASAPVLATGSQGMQQSLRNKAAYGQLRDLLSAVAENNEDGALKRFDDTDAYYHATRALLADRNFRDMGMRQRAAEFVVAVDALQARTKDRLIKPLARGTFVDTAAVTADFTPADGPLMPKRAAAGAMLSRR